MYAERVADEVIALLDERGGGAYFGEAVTQREHALQTAHRAEEAGASDRLVVAALLHDIGHLLHGAGEGVADEGTDARHEEAGYLYLCRYFAADVVEPVRLHVAAKRYLCATDPAYDDALSPASRQSLALQGGPFAEDEARGFERNPHFAAACALRRWDDAAKIPGLTVPGPRHYRDRIVAAVLVPLSERMRRVEPTFAVRYRQKPGQ